ncbi:MAG TPA: SGNH/GDSL hydrolase family protein, partial [Emticicia sp.]
HEAVASHYQLPSINLAKEVADRLSAKEFSWEFDFKDLHPSPFGQEIYFQSIKYLLNESFKNFEAANVVSSINDPLPKPLKEKNFEGGKYVNINEAKIQKGWQLIEKWQPTDGVGTRDGFVNCPVLEANEPDASLSLTFTGNAVGIGLVSGPDAGEVMYSIDNGPYKSMDLYTQWSHFLHLPWYKLFATGLSDKKHTLNLKVSNNKNPKSKGTACRIVYFLVNSTGK